MLTDSLPAKVQTSAVAQTALKEKMMAKKKWALVRPRQLLEIRARHAGCHLSSLGDLEQLAGVDVRSPTERKALWDPFRHLWQGPTQVCIDAVMEHCAVLIIQRLDAGQLSLLPNRS